jgi:peptidoglycan/LPS O-acetylase OafA/YrhL
VRRLYPALLAYVVLMIPVVYTLQSLAEPRLGLDPPTYFRMLPFAVTYLVNYAHIQAMALGHLWSLSCEMQFYLLAPLIFLAGCRANLSRGLVWGFILLVLISLGFSRVQSGTLGWEKYHFEFAVWPMMFGFFCEYQQARLRRVPAWLVWPASIGALVVFVAGSVVMLASHEMKKLVIASGTLVMIPCWFSYLKGLPIPGVPGRVLAWLGERTYSIYLWQQPLTICNYLPFVWHPVGALLSMFVGAASFHFFERPFLSATRRK